MVMAFFVAFFVLQKVVFMLYYNSLMHDATLADHFSVIWHGLPMDFSVAGYLTVIPALMILAGIWVRHRWLDTALKAYFAVTAILLASIALLDLELYGYWGFRLDMTPLFYFSTSPSAAFASATAHQIFIGVIAVAAIAYGIYTAFSRTVCRIHPVTYRRVTATVVLTLLTASLFIPIRGGVTVSTMNLSRAYFSQKKILNHAAINPAFSLLYSATHQNDYAKRYRFMTDEEAAAAMVSLAEFATSPIPGKKAVTDSIPINSTVNDTLLDCTEPDIYLVILESFSAQLMPSLGGEDVAEHLDSVAQTGICFTNFYANSFRTDRALPSILSGFPAQPSMSLLKYTDKTEKLPSIARELKNAGYGTTYYYGGDINFANINAYLISAGYDLVVCDKDFPIADRTGKWGAHDHLLFDRVLADLDAYSKVNTPHAPMFRVIQTSSSHEPFEVPYSDPKFAGHPQKKRVCLHRPMPARFPRKAQANTTLCMLFGHYRARPPRRLASRPPRCRQTPPCAISPHRRRNQPSGSAQNQRPRLTNRHRGNPSRAAWDGCFRIHVQQRYAESHVSTLCGFHRAFVNRDCNRLGYYRL